MTVVPPGDVLRFVLQPCRVLRAVLVPTSDEPAEYSWRSLVAKFAPSRNAQALGTLRLLQQGCFLGLARPPEQDTADYLVNFVLLNEDRSGRLEGLSRSSALVERIVEAYRVERADWGSRVVESG